MTAQSGLSLDHVVLAGPDLERARQEFADLTGLVPAPGGPHAGLGTQNALASLGDDLYLELIVPDPATASDQNLGGAFASLDGLSLFTWALRTEDLPGLADQLTQEGLGPSPIIETRRDQPDGSRLIWDLMGLPGLGGAWPFFIDWRECVHPGRTNPSAGELLHFEASLPTQDVEKLPFVSAANVTFAAGPPALSLSIETKNGTIDWSATAPRGLFG